MKIENNFIADISEDFKKNSFHTNSLSLFWDNLELKWLIRGLLAWDIAYSVQLANAVDSSTYGVQYIWSPNSKEGATICRTNIRR